MSEVDSSLIRRGFWINHDRGSILGATITTNQNISNLIIAVLAILVSIATTSAWDLILFAIHQLRATSAPKSGLYRQQQVLLRMLAPPGTFFIESLKMAKVWWLEDTHAALRCLLPSLLALVFAATSVAAGVGSSFIVSTTNLQVLVNGATCRDVNLTTYFSAWTQDFDASLLSAAASFSDQCYGPGPLPSRCNFYVHPRIQFSTAAGHCPFTASTCLEPDDALVMDSGYLDSNDIFGLNTPHNERTLFRRQTICAPLDATPHMQIANASVPRFEAALGRNTLPGEQVLALSWGPILHFSTAPGFENLTAVHSMTNAETFPFFSTHASVAFSNPALVNYSAFAPIDAIHRNDSDVLLLFIHSNMVKSLNPINDPLYSAHQPRTDQATSGNFTVYTSDQPVGVMGCSSQYQFCISSASGPPECTPFQGTITSGFSDLLPSASARQVSFMELLGLGSLLGEQIFHSRDINPAFLNSTSQAYSGFMDGLPDDQWKLDARNMETLSWAYMQNFIATHAAGYVSVDEPDLLVTPTSKEGKQLCQDQRVVKPGGFANVNVLGLVLVLVVTVLLVILDFGCLRILILLGDFKRHVFPRLLFWFEDGVLQMQRSAYEACSSTLWGQTDNEIPVTGHGERLRNLKSYQMAESEQMAYDSPVSVTKQPLAAQVMESPVRTSSRWSTDSKWSCSVSPTSTVVPIPPPWPSVNYYSAELDSDEKGYKDLAA